MQHTSEIIQDCRMQYIPRSFKRLLRLTSSDHIQFLRTRDVGITCGQPLVGFWIRSTRCRVVATAVRIMLSPWRVRFVTFTSKLKTAAFDYCYALYSIVKLVDAAVDSRSSSTPRAFEAVNCVVSFETYALCFANKVSNNLTLSPTVVTRVFHSIRGSFVWAFSHCTIRSCLDPKRTIERRDEILHGRYFRDFMVEKHGIRLTYCYTAYQRSPIISTVVLWPSRPPTC